jgi:hypothetical protein
MSEAPVSNAVRRPSAKLRAVVWGLAALVALELGFRAVRSLRGETVASWRIRNELRQIAGAGFGIFERKGSADPEASFIHPYVAWETPEGARELDQSLRRGRSRADGAFTLWVFGGTSAHALATAGRGELERGLGDIEGHSRIEVASFARPRFKSPQHALFLQFLFGLGLRPDAVLIVDGRDELVLGRANLAAEIHPLMPDYAVWSKIAARGATDREALDELLVARVELRAAARLSSIALRLGLHHSALCGELVLSRARALMNACELRKERAQARIAAASRSLALRGPTLPANADDALALCADAWREDARAIDAMCRARGIPCAHVLEPLDELPAAQPEAEREVLAHGAPLLRARARELASAGVVVDAQDGPEASAPLAAAAARALRRALGAHTSGR